MRHDCVHTLFRRLSPVVLAAVAGLAGAGAAAQTGTVPPMVGQGAVRYACGGIGLDESTAMRAAMKSHPLSLLFAKDGGDYLADVAVRIQDALGAEVVALRAGGPVCLIDLPAGRYRIEAASSGLTRTHTVTVGASPVTADFRF